MNAVLYRIFLYDSGYLLTFYLVFEREILNSQYSGDSSVADGFFDYDNLLRYRPKYSRQRCLQLLETVLSMSQGFDGENR